jgi:hypothetical protein
VTRLEYERDVPYPNCHTGADAVDRWRVVEQVERLTSLLRDGECLPRSFHDLIREHGIDPERAALADLVEDQGCNLSGTLLTAAGEVVVFDIDFAGEGYGAWPSWGHVEEINRWDVSRPTDRRPRQGSPQEVALRMMGEGRL